MGRLHIGPDGASWDPDESYRTCSVCGGDCEPEPYSVDGHGVRIACVCPRHGVHSVVDPFEGERANDQ